MKALIRVTCALAAMLALTAVSSVLVTKLRAQQPTGRIAAAIDNTARVTMRGTRSPLTLKATDMGRMPADAALNGMSIVFNRSAAQKTDLDALIAAQQNPASPLYHHWLTPDEFAARYGMDDTDLSKVESWLQEQGFAVSGVSRGRDRIIFSGTVSQIESAFGAQMHYYNQNGVTHFAPSSDLSIPAALAPVVSNVSNLSSFRLKPRFKRPQPKFTSSQSGHTFLSPADVATIYDIKPVYNAGFDGAGQSIAVVGQTSVALTDIENFQSAAGLTVKDPTLVLEPGTGNVAEFSGDESESDLDLEYSGGMAPGATIYFVYTGDNPNFGVFDAIVYAVQNDIAPIISDSYGLCETALSAGEYSSFNSFLQQGAAQGQSIIVPAGDSGSPDCEGVTGLSNAQQQALAVDFPASSQYVTAMGGSEFLAADVCNASACSTPPAPYWAPATNGVDVISSAQLYIPEQVWNDDSPPANGFPAFLGSGGGGVSTLTPKPAWQTGVAGISGTMRLVPDISLSGSPDNAGFLYCTSDTSAWGSTQVASCNSGFRDASTSGLTVAGGTSFDAPIFAGLVAVINQKENSIGQGVVSPTLYQLASNGTTYSNAFHDIKTGNNNCSAAGVTVCSGAATTQYSAGTGYDTASGLGSIDFNNLVMAWPAGSSKTASATTVSAATKSPSVGVSDAITIDVASGSGSVLTTPTGTVNVLVDGAAPNGSPFTLASGSTGFNFVSSAGGSHVITVSYSGDSNFAQSTSTLALGNQGFRLTATSPTITAGANGSSTITITPQDGYTGSISWTLSSSPAFTNGCFSISNATVSGTTAVNAPLTIKTNSSACAGSAMLGNSGQSNMVVSANHSGHSSPLRLAPLTFGMVGLMLAGVFMFRPGKMRSTAGSLLLLLLMLGLPACGGGSSSGGGGGSNVTAGTYNVTVVGKDTTSATISGSVAIAVTVH